jgi:O-antigen/teichoic acid export membrane protein
MLIPVQQITSTLSDVMFPALSKIQDEKDRVRRLYLRAISAIGLVTIPLMLLLLVVTDSFVLAVFGPKWSGVIPVLQILCLAGVILPIASTVGWIFRSQGRADWQFYWGLFGTSVTLGLTVLGTWLGVELSITPPDPGAPLAAYAPASDVIGATCVGASYVVAKCLLVPGSYYFAGKLIDMKVREVPLALKEVFASAVTAAIAIYALEETVTDGLGPWLELGIQAPTGILLYLAIVHLFQVDAYLDVRKQLFDKWREFQGVD